MGQARSLTMNPLEIELHHGFARVVQQMFLMGTDPITGKDYSYRRARLLALHEYLSSVIAVEVGSINVMSNHFHNLLRNRPDLVQKMTDEEVLWRYRKAWPRYYPGRRKWDYAPTDEEIEGMLLRAKNEPDYLPWVRTRLGDISFFMGQLEQIFARQANRERPKKGGHFWAGPYGNRRIDTDEDAISTFLYCDLQQAKAGMVTKLEDSDYSSIQAQIKTHAQQAFEEFHGRKPENTEQDAEELEQLNQLYANCCFSPLVQDAPLITEPDDNPPPSEYVLPAGYLYQQTPDTHDANGERIDINKDEVPQKPAKKRRGRPKKPKRRSIHDRLKLKQRRRASRCNILGLSWEQYSPFVHRIADQLIQQRRGNSPAPASPDNSASSCDSHAPASADTNTSGSTAKFNRASSDSIAPAPPDTIPDGSTATFKRAIKDFGHWLTTEAAEAFNELLTLRAILPRSPSDSSDSTE